MLSKSERTTLFEIVATVQKLLAGEVGLIEGAELIATLSYQIGAIDPNLFSPFVDICESSYEIVIRKPSPWAPSFIEERTLSREGYERDVRSGIPEIGRRLLVACEPLLNECPVCGFECGTPPYDAAGEPSYETCRACGFFFDALDTEFDWGDWRMRWIAKGMPFAYPPPPTGWEPPTSFRLGQT